MASLPCQTSSLDDIMWKVAFSFCYSDLRCQDVLNILYVMPLTNSNYCNWDMDLYLFTLLIVRILPSLLYDVMHHFEIEEDICVKAENIISV